jgi:hypothetical protein
LFADVPIPYIPYTCPCGKEFHHKENIDFELIVQSLYMPSWFDFSDSFTYDTSVANDPTSSSLPSLVLPSPTLKSPVTGDENSTFQFLSQFYRAPRQVDTPCHQLQTRLLSSLINFVRSPSGKGMEPQNDPTATFLKINSDSATPSMLAPFLISFLDGLRCCRGSQASVTEEEFVSVLKEKCKKDGDLGIDPKVLESLEKSLEEFKNKREINENSDINNNCNESKGKHLCCLLPDFLPPSFSPASLRAPCSRFYLLLYQMIHLSMSAILLYSFHTSTFGLYRSSLFPSLPSTVQSSTFLCCSVLVANECVRLLVCQNPIVYSQ